MSKRFHPGLKGCAVVATTVAMLLALPASGRQDVKPLDESLRVMRTAVNAQRDGSHLGMLLALRQLRDPDLAPVFERLLDHREWQVQVNAVLGLAEQSAAERVQSSHLARVAPLAQEAVIASAMDLDVLDRDQFPQILASDTLSPMARLLLYAELAQGDGVDEMQGGMSCNQLIDTNTVREIMNDREHRVGALAGLILAQCGDATPLHELTERLRQEGRSGERQLLWILDAIRAYRFTKSNDWVRSLHAQSDNSRELSDTAVWTAVAIDPARNIDLWRQELGPDATFARRVRYGLMLLSAGPDVPASAYDRIAGTEPLTMRMADVGVAIARGVDASSAMIELLNVGHIRTMEWVMETAKSRPPAEAERIYAHVLAQLDAGGVAHDPRRAGPRGEWVAAGVTAASQLFEIRPDLVARKLREASPNGALQEAILLGLLDSRDPLAGELARELNLTGFGRADSMTMVLMAKHSDSLSRGELNRLGLIASGGGRISNELRTQAAWLYLKQSGNLASALNSIFQ